MNLYHAEAQRRREENAKKDFCKRSIDFLVDYDLEKISLYYKK